jgi:hypothetical protein
MAIPDTPEGLFQAILFGWVSPGGARANASFQHAAEDLAGGRFGNGVHELDRADLLVRRHPAAT